jgi:DNA-nicking Smr family endonuclease
MVKRVLSEDEKALWRSIARTAKPLRRRKAVVPDHDDEPAGISAAPRKSAKAAHVAVVAAPAPRSAPPPLAPIGRREKARLAKGRHPIDARLDLHGMTQARAHRMLIAFLRQAHSDGCTFVLVITGKGKVSASSEGERGVLRRQVPHWLDLPELRSLVVGFEQAHIGHGGEGALYVRLRRAR